MIRIETSADDLKDQINSHNSGWLVKAKKKTDELESDPTKNVTSIWSPIKQVFTKLQNSKCVFCEKLIENQPIEQDVEHFRPKNNVKRWHVPQWMEEDEDVIVNQPSSGSEDGYRLLSYNYLNYAAACKTCNSTRKRDLFPIAGPRKNNSKNPNTMKAEKAYLIFPIGDIDDDPEDLIEFFGLSPQARKSSGFGRKRALVTIELFKLDDFDERPYLFKTRAKNIWLLFKCLRQIDTGNTAEKAEGQIVADFLTSPASEHTNCLRSYRRLYESDLIEAESVMQEAFQLWINSSP